jgi:hypothetical protein
MTRRLCTVERILGLCLEHVAMELEAVLGLRRLEVV